MMSMRVRGLPVESPGGPTRFSYGDVARGALALVVLLSLLLGMPVALWFLAAELHPLEGLSLSTLDSALTSRDDGSLLLAALMVVAWAGWLVFAVTVSVEIVAFVRGVPTPRLPLLRLPQQGAAALVATAALLVTSGSISLATPVLRPVAAAALEAPATSGPRASAVDTAAVPSVGESRRYPTVIVRRHDTLWSLAERHLGSGERFREIVALNLGHDQGDGRALTDARWVYPGWVLRLPPDARGANDLTAAVETSGEHIVRSGDSLWKIADEELGDGERYTDLYELNRGKRQPDGLRLDDADEIRPGWRIELPVQTVATGPHAEPQLPPRPAPPRTPDQPPAVVASLPTPNPMAADDAPTSTQTEDATTPVSSLVLGLGSITAAGLMWELRRRRRVQQRTRVVGQRIAMPGPELAAAEAQVASATRPVTAQTVADALGALAQACAVAQRPLPDLTLVRVSPSSITLELQLDEPDAVLPFAAVSARTWRLDGLAPACPSGQNPYPALVTLGVAGDELLLLNLESVGTLALSGPAASREQMLCALAVDVAVGPLSNAAAVTFANCFSELAATLDRGRSRHVPSIEQAQREVRVRTAAVRTMLDAGDEQDVRSARSSEGSTDATAAEIVIADRELGQPPAPWSGVSAIVVDPHPTNGWRVDIGDSGATLHPIGIAFEPQRLTHADLQRAVSLLATAETDNTHEIAPAEPTDERTAVSAALPEVPATVLDLRDDVPAPPRLLVLGSVHVERADDQAAPHRRRRATELVAYLALHGGASSYQIDEAMWPGKRVEKTTRSPFISRARQWLGRTSEGEPYLPQVADGGSYRLRPDVSCDWHDFVRFAQLGLASGPDGAGALEAALALVRGRPFLGVDPTTYSWAEADAQEMISAIVDVAHVLSVMRCEAGDYRGAQEAVAKGLLAEPCSELLYRDAIRAAGAAGDTDEVSRLVQRLRHEIELVDPDDTMDETTVDLIESCVG